MGVFSDRVQALPGRSADDPRLQSGSTADVYVIKRVDERRRFDGEFAGFSANDEFALKCVDAAREAEIRSEFEALRRLSGGGGGDNAQLAAISNCWRN